MALLQLLNSSHARERDKALLRSTMVGECLEWFLLGLVRSQAVPCRFCGAPDNDGHLFWECTFPPLVEIRENPEFHDLMREDKSQWPRCFLWHGWLPKFPESMGPLLGQLVLLRVLFTLLRLRLEATLLVFLLNGVTLLSLLLLKPPLLPESPNVWTDGRLVLDRLACVSSSGSGFFLLTGAPRRCGVLTTWGGIAGIGLGRLFGESMLQLTRVGGGSSPVKTEPPQIVLLLLFGTLLDDRV